METLFVYILVTLNKSSVTPFHCYGWRCFHCCVTMELQQLALLIVAATLTLLPRICNTTKETQYVTLPPP
jgi:hypothetical protein